MGGYETGSLKKHDTRVLPAFNWMMTRPEEGPCEVGNEGNKPSFPTDGTAFHD